MVLAAAPQVGHYPRILLCRPSLSSQSLRSPVASSPDHNDVVAMVATTAAMATIPLLGPVASPPDYNEATVRIAVVAMAAATTTTVQLRRSHCRVPVSLSSGDDGNRGGRAVTATTTVQLLFLLLGPYRLIVQPQ